MQPCEGHHEQRGIEASRFPGLLRRTWAHGLWAPTPAPTVKKRPDQDPREGSLELGWVRRCWLSCRSGSTRSCPCPTLTSHSHPHPICAPEAPFMASAFSATGDAGTPEAMAPIIVVPPSNRSVVAGSSETTLECIANARYAAGPPPAGSGWLPQQQRTWSHSRAVGTARYGKIAWTLPRPCSAVFILYVTFILEVSTVTVG